MGNSNGWGSAYGKSHFGYTPGSTPNNENKANLKPLCQLEKCEVTGVTETALQPVQTTHTLIGHNVPEVVDEVVVPTASGSTGEDVWHQKITNYVKNIFK